MTQLGAPIEKACRRRRRFGAFVGSGAMLVLPVTLAALNAPTAAAAPLAGVCGDPTTPIHDVQGPTMASPIEGATVTVEGVVTLVLASGFYVQATPIEFDADPRSSEGVLIVTTTPAVSAGDRVRATGVVTEFEPAGATAPRTQLADATAASCSTGDPAAPIDLPLPVHNPDDWEQYEDMLISVAPPLTVTGTAGLGPADEIDLAADGRLLEPTSAVEPGNPAADLQQLNDLRRIRSRYDWREAGLSAGDTIRVGDVLADPLVGVLDQQPDGYRVEPLDPAALSVDPANPRPAGPATVGGILRVASMDLGGYFTTLESGGATTADELVRQREKLVAALLGLDADIVGVTGVENDGGAALDDLRAALDDSSSDSWATVDPGRGGTRATQTGILYRVGTVVPVGSPAVLDGSVDPRFDDARNAPSLAQTFRLTGGAELTVVVAELAARTGCGDDVGDGQDQCSPVRTAAARAIADWIGTDPTVSGDPDAMLIGDLAAQAREDPIDVLRAGGLVDLVDGAYTSVSAGQTGAVDHALASASLAAQVTGSTVWHINADEPALLDYRTRAKTPAEATRLYAPDAYRSAPTDPLLVSLNLLGEAPVAVDDAVTTPEDTAVEIEVTDNDRDANGDLDPASVTILAPPAEGAAAVGSAGTVTYTPAPDTNGTVGFAYRICDATDLCDDATVRVTITPVDDPPMARDDQATVAHDGQVIIDVLANDNDADGRADLDTGTLTVTIPAGNGTATVVRSGSLISYRAATGTAGSDRFGYRICDPDGLCDTATVAVTLTPSPATSTTPSATATPTTTAPTTGSTITTSTASQTLAETGASSAAGPAAILGLLAIVGGTAALIRDSRRPPRR